jgi:hypothetical protein
MLPARQESRFRLADTLADCLAAVRGEPREGSFPAVRQAVVLLVDGLGASALRERAGHARTLAGVLGRGATADAGFPTTTASALASLATGAAPGEHGMVGFTAYDPAHDRVVNQLSGLDGVGDPVAWQRMPTVFERATRAGVRGVAIGPERFRTTAFTHAVLRGADYVAGERVSDRVDRALEVLATRDPAIVYLYVSELDVIAHRWGWSSPQWTVALEELDGAVARLAGALRPDQGLVVTADHGILDVPEENHIVLDDPALADPVRFWAGEPRCLQLHLHDPASADAVAADYAAALGRTAWVATRDEAVTGGLFGPEVDPEVLPRIGHVLVGARGPVAFYPDEDDQGRGMIGQHGSADLQETRVPRLRFGAFA